MQTVELILVILFGLCFGSFASLASYRLPREEGIAAGRSRCPDCAKTLKVRDLVPVLSWLLARGRCRYCKSPVSARYPLIEILTALSFAAVYMAHGLNFASVMLMLMSVSLIVMIVSDLETMLIPDEVHLALLVLALGYHAAVATPPLQVAGGFALMVALGLLLHHGYYYIRGKDGLGYGDVKFFAIAGAWLGLLPLLPFLLVAGLLGVACGLLWKMLGKGELFPFGPCLALSLWVCVLYSKAINHLLYMNII